MISYLTATFCEMNTHGSKVGQLSQTNLHGENDHCETNDCGDSHRHDDRLRSVEAGDCSHHVGQAESQDGLESKQTHHISSHLHIENII